MWTEKYRPTSLLEVVGNKYAVDQFDEWLCTWKAGYKPKQKGAIIYGPAGTGKSTVVTLLSQEIVEHNATSTHNFKEFLTNNTKSKSLFNKSKTILIEDPDMLDEEELQSLSGAIRKTSMPIVIITNNLFDYKFAKLKKNCILVEFKALSVAEIKKRICLVAIKENILDQMRIDAIAKRCNGDLRVAINDLESGTNASRDNKSNVLLTMRKIFYATSYAAAIKAGEHSDLDVDMLFEWIYENIPTHISDPLDLCEAMDALSKADVLRKKAKTDSVWNNYVLEFISAGVWACKQRSKPQLGLPFKFPVRMMHPNFLGE